MRHIDNISKIKLYTQKVQKDNSFIIFKKSNSLFKVTFVKDSLRKKIIDFTKIKKNGVDIKELLKHL